MRGMDSARQQDANPGEPKRYCVDSQQSSRTEDARSCFDSVAQNLYCATAPRTQPVRVNPSTTYHSRPPPAAGSHEAARSPGPGGSPHLHACTEGPQAGRRDALPPAAGPCTAQEPRRAPASRHRPEAGFRKDCRTCAILRTVTCHRRRSPWTRTTSASTNRPVAMTWPSAFATSPRSATRWPRSWRGTPRAPSPRYWNSLPGRRGMRASSLAAARPPPRSMKREPWVTTRWSAQSTTASSWRSFAPTWATSRSRSDSTWPCC